MSKSLILFCAASFLITFVNSAQAQVSSPKREFRGVWIATVSNIDFPSTGGLNVEKFKEEWLAKVKAFQQAGFNSLIVQVRPVGDAFYFSKISPWSKFLSGTQGKELESGFDPLRYMVETTHNHNLDFHAWLNPYRAAMDTLTINLSANHPYRQHPEWFLKYGGKIYFNPAMPEVRNYITEIVMEVIVEYNVDGIHFDDYFYPYPVANETFPDSADFVKYGYGFSNLGAWRRSNVDKLISQISAMMKSYTPHIKFGISPFGVWRNKSVDPVLGSDTRAGASSYDDLYADVRGWLEKGWIDYVAPQLYWHIGFDLANYATLVNWWSKNSFGKRLYIGQAMYKVNNSPQENWSKPGEIPKQIRLNRSFPEVNGSIFFNATTTLKNPLGVLDSLHMSFYKQKALWPEMPYLGLENSLAPVLSSFNYRDGILQFKCDIDKKDENAAYIILYRFEDRLPGDFNNPGNIFGIYRLNGRKNFLIQDNTVEVDKMYTYSASTVNHQYTESLLSKARTVMIGKNRLKKVK